VKKDKDDDLSCVTEMKALKFFAFGANTDRIFIISKGVPFSHATLKLSPFHRHSRWLFTNEKNE
jgi:hypothetical protein